MEVVDVDKSFGKFQALNGVNLKVHRGEVHGFLGPNGAGKSTTIRIILGLYRATSGHTEVLGFDPSKQQADVTRRVS
ncbi:ATP-binding cassette domain-containing protein, partial [Mycobacterium tuberculosis]|nr:ATP-binding cassette domain-containing protein [Mycobacterium tuberculosis]